MNNSHFSTGLEILIEGLLPFTMYEFSVRADTATTPGQFTSLIRARTKEGSK